MATEIVKPVGLHAQEPVAKFGIANRKQGVLDHQEAGVKFPEIRARTRRDDREFGPDVGRLAREIHLADNCECALGPAEPPLRIGLDRAQGVVT